MARPRPNPITAHIHAAVEKIDSICGRARNDIRARLLEHIDEHPNSPWSYANVARLERTLTAMYQQWGASVNTVFDDFLPREYQAGYDRAKNELRKSGVWQNITGGPDMRRIRNALDSVYNNVALRTDKMTFDHIRQLRNFSAKVFREASITGETRRQVSERLQNEALQVPGFQFTDIAGRKWSHKSYFEMLARTELMNGARDSYEQECAEQGYNIMLLSISGHCCEACARFEGKYFSIGPNRYGLPTKDDLEAAGVFHPNCTHSYSAVPDYIIEKEFGKSKSETKMEKSLGQNIRSVLRSFKPEPEDNFKRFDGSFSSEKAQAFDKQLRKSKLSNAQVDEFNAHMQTTEHLLTKPPEFIVTDSDDAHTDINTWEMYIRKGENTWGGCRNTISHEWGELLFNNVMTEAEKAKFQDAIKNDLLLIKKNSLLNKSSWDTEKDLTSELSHSIFGKDYSELTANEQTRIFGFFDVAGSMSGGHFGFGHDNYLDEVGAGRFGNDAFAGIYVAVTHGYEEFKKTYPHTWKYMENLLKK